mgnify:CR=1 FL=1
MARIVRIKTPRAFLAARRSSGRRRPGSSPEADSSLEAVLDLLEQEPGLSVKDVAEHLGLSLDASVDAMLKLERTGIVQREGPRYTIAE